MTALSTILFFLGILLMGAEGDTLGAQAIANISGLVLFAVSMTMMKNLKQNQKI
jgi:hypothetical protein